jgi:hypothetical protein
MIFNGINSLALVPLFINGLYLVSGTLEKRSLEKNPGTRRFRIRQAVDRR